MVDLTTCKPIMGSRVRHGGGTTINHPEKPAASIAALHHPSTSVNSQPGSGTQGLIMDAHSINASDRDVIMTPLCEEAGGLRVADQAQVKINTSLPAGGAGRGGGWPGSRCLRAAHAVQLVVCQCSRGVGRTGQARQRTSGPV